MKTYLVFFKNGEIKENTCSSVCFSKSKFLEYNHYKKYEEFIILYNENNDDMNLTNFFFTDDQYRGDIALLKYKDDNIKNLTVKNYMNRFKCYTNNELYYSSEEEEYEYLI